PAVSEIRTLPTFLGIAETGMRSLGPTTLSKRRGRKSASQKALYAMFQQVLDRRKQALVSLIVETREDISRAFQVKIESVRTELYNFAYRLSGNREDTEDLLQESYFKAFRYFHQLRDRGKFKEWIFQITANQFRNTLKRRKREQMYFTDEFETLASQVPQNPSHDPDIQAEQGDQALRLKAAIDVLDPKMREALVLFELQGFSIEETASTLAISPGTVKSRLHYARKRLHDQLMQTDLGPALKAEYTS
ncbi:MAG: RNA polymerase sigma factor, partial [bacterium]